MLKWMFTPAPLGIRIAGMMIGAAIALTIITAFPAKAAGFYVGAYGGANWNDVNYDAGKLTIDDNAGYVIGGVVGTSIASVPGLRIEGDLSYRRNGLDIEYCHTALEGFDSTWGLLANAVYDVPVGSFPVRPYVLAGVGYASRTAGVEGYGIETSSDGLAYQLGVGANTTVADGVQLGVGYRYFQAPDLHYAGINAEGSNHAVVASVTFGFN